MNILSHFYKLLENNFNELTIIKKNLLHKKTRKIEFIIQ